MQNNITIHKTTMYRTKQRYNITKRFNQIQNNIVILKKQQYKITEHKTKLLHTKQQFNKIRHNIEK